MWFEKLVELFTGKHEVAYDVRPDRKSPKASRPPEKNDDEAREANRGLPRVSAALAAYSPSSTPAPRPVVRGPKDEEK